MPNSSNGSGSDARSAVPANLTFVLGPRKLLALDLDGTLLNTVDPNGDWYRTETLDITPAADLAVQRRIAELLNRVACGQQLSVGICTGRNRKFVDEILLRSGLTADWLIMGAGSVVVRDTKLVLVESEIYPCLINQPPDCWYTHAPDQPPGENDLGQWLDFSPAERGRVLDQILVHLAEQCRANLHQHQVTVKKFPAEVTIQFPKSWTGEIIETFLIDRVPHFMPHHHQLIAYTTLLGQAWLGFGGVDKGTAIRYLLGDHDQLALYCGDGLNDLPAMVHAKVVILPEDHVHGTVEKLQASGWNGELIIGDGAHCHGVLDGLERYFKEHPF